MTKTIVFVLVAVGLSSACGGDDAEMTMNPSPGPAPAVAPPEATPTPTPPAATPPASAQPAGAGNCRPPLYEAQVDLTLSGDVVATLQGPARCGTCDAVSFVVRSADFPGAGQDFSFTVFREKTEAHKIILNAQMPSRSYWWDFRKPDAGMATAEVGMRTDLDLKMSRLAGSGSILVKGSIVCEP